MKFLLLVLAITVTAGYLFLSYVGFYNFIGSTNLKAVASTNPVVIAGTNTDSNLKYIAIGDSLSAGVGCSKVEESFPYLLAQKFASAGYNAELINLSVPGSTSKDVLFNQLPKLIQESPNYVTILIGVNDIHNRVPLSTFSSNYQEIIKSILENTDAKIIVINLPFLGSSKIARFPYNILLNTRTKQFNKAISEIVTSLSNSNRISFVDLYSETVSSQLLNPSYYSQDLFHPSAVGYEIWDTLIYDY